MKRTPLPLCGIALASLLAPDPFGEQDAWQ